MTGSKPAWITQCARTAWDIGDKTSFSGYAQETAITPRVCEEEAFRELCGETPTRGPCHICIRHSITLLTVPLRVLCPDTSIKDDRSQPSQCRKNVTRDVCMDCTAEPMESHIGFEDTGSYPGSPWVRHGTQKWTQFILSTPLRIGSNLSLHPAHGPSQVVNCDTLWHISGARAPKSYFVFYMYFLWRQASLLT